MILRNTISFTDRPILRRGIILPLLALTIVVMVGFLALAIDLGMMAIAKTQVQQAADLAALTAMRTLNGNSSTNYNQSAATTNAQNVVTYNSILGTSLQSSQLQLTFGSYDYNQTAGTFQANFPPTTGSATTAISTTVTSSSLPGAFSKILKTQLLPNVSATAQAVHRPRDIALVLDLSGSMRMGTCLGFDFYPTSRTSNNPDSNIPTFGHYSSANANLQGPSTNQTSSDESYTISPCNTTATNSSYSLTYVNNFMQNAAYATPLIRAFDSFTSSDGGKTWTAPTSGTPQLPPSSYASVPNGDVPLFKQGSTTTYATDVKDVLPSTSTTPNILWELDGYSAYTNGSLDTSGTGGIPYVWTQVDYSAPAAQFDGYTQGPGYYGKTFFLWPPDPRNGPITLASTVKSYLTALGMNATDVTTLGNNWATYQSQGMTTGLTNLQSWLTGATTSGGPYIPTSTTKVVPGSSNKAPIYYAVCRLFNRAYPAGASNGQFVADWRNRFFNFSGAPNNTVLLNSSGSLDLPGTSTYTIDYNAILTWIAQTPNPFPTQMRGGRIKYYGSIPTAITGSWPSYGSTDQQFWVEFIDHVLGFRQTASGVYTDISGMAGYGSDFTWGTTSQSNPPSLPQYMSYTDNPLRPNLRYWFSPILMVDYLQNYNMDTNVSNYYYMQPGDSYEAPIYTAKEAYVAAINTMQQNHPNDYVTVVPYSWPRGSATDTSGRLNCVRSPLGTNYTYATAALTFPFSSLNADGSANNTELTPYTADPATGQIPSSDFTDIPRADGDTSFAMALMLCHNQFAVTQPTDTTLRSYASSSPITFPSGMAGGLGRKGAQKLIIFETDGLPNCSATASLVNAGTYSYYKIRYNMNNPSQSEYPSTNATTINDPTVLSQTNSLVQTLASTYSTSRNPFRLYAVGFGPVFQGSNASAAKSTLQTMQYYAGTQSSASTALPSNQIITGTDTQMSTNMIKTFTQILQNGVQIALTK
jgi:Flp pilus assembly protein TadG